jgi:hypothetical protein
MNGRFVKGDVFAIRAEAAEKALDIILPASLSNKYSAEKAPTGGIPTSWADPAYPNRVYQIRWVNNFNLKPRPGVKIDPNVSMEYEIQFEKPDLGPVTYTKLFYFLGGTIQPFDASDYEELADGKIAAKLRISDPPIGWGGT